MPAACLGCFEVILRLAGFGCPTTFFVKTSDGAFFQPNPRFCWQFYPRERATIPNPFLMPARKPPGAHRVFVLGESAAAGAPDPAFGFARMLEVMFRLQFPQARVEVYNAAIRGVNSHIILEVARECAAHEPDLMILYMGNNEAVGYNAPDPAQAAWRRWPAVASFRHWLKTMRTTQALEAATGAVRGRHARSPPEQDMAFFRARRLRYDAPERQRVYVDFRHHLETICDLAEGAGARIILGTVAVNLKDFPPLASLHRSPWSDSDHAKFEPPYAQGVAAEAVNDLQRAISCFETAATCDNHFADLHFRLARCFSALGQPTQALTHFALARDWDALQFRTDSRMNEIVRQVAAEKSAAHVSLQDFEHVFAGNALSEQGIPGQALFNDHVHFTFGGDYLVASTLLPQAAKLLNLGPAAAPSASAEACAKALAYTAWDAYNVRASMTALTKVAPFLDQLEHERRQAQAEQAVAASATALQSEVPAVLAAYRRAIAANPGDWQLHSNFGRMFMSGLKDYREAITEFEKVVELFPQTPAPRVRLANALALAGRIDEAINQLRTALRLCPGDPSAEMGLHALLPARAP